MHTAAALLDLNTRTHRILEGLIGHCAELSAEELDRELEGFGYPTVRLQLHHMIGAQKYWIGVLQGMILADEDDPEYRTAASLEAYRQDIFAMTEGYLRGASPEELNTARPMQTWGGREQTLVPALVFIRTMTHIFQHQGQILAMCRLMGKPGGGLDFPGS